MKLKFRCPYTGFLLLYVGPPPCPFIYILSMAAFVLQRQRWTVATETVLQNLKYLLSVPLQEKSADTCSKLTLLTCTQVIFRGSIIQGQRVNSKDLVRPTWHLHPVSNTHLHLMQRQVTQPLWVPIFPTRNGANDIYVTGLLWSLKRDKCEILWHRLWPYSWLNKC